MTAADETPGPRCGERTDDAAGNGLARNTLPAVPPSPRPPVPPPPAGYTPAPASGFDALIPARNPQALAAYYIGLFSLIPILGLPMGIVALVLGIKGARYARAHAGVHGTTHAWVGIICGGFWALVNTGLVSAAAYALVMQAISLP